MRREDVETHFYPHTGFESFEQSKIEEMNYCEHYHLHPPAEESDLPLKWHEAAPCIGKRVLTCHLTSTGAELKFIWSGNTWAFRDAMDEFGVKGRLAHQDVYR